MALTNSEIEEFEWAFLNSILYNILLWQNTQGEKLMHYYMGLILFLYQHFREGFELQGKISNEKKTVYSPT